MPNEEMTLRLLPYIMANINQDFSFQECEFGLGVGKRNTARANVFRMMKFSHRAYTM